MAAAAATAVAIGRRTKGARGAKRAMVAAARDKYLIANLPPEEQERWNRLAPGPGRRCTLDAGKADQIVAALRLGLPLAVAASVAGVSDGTLADWQAQGRVDLENGRDTLHGRLASLLKEAEAGAVVACAERLQRANTNDWQRWAWMLERRWPEWFGRRDALAVSMQGDVRITVEHVADWHARDVIDVTPEPQREPQKRGRSREAKAAAD
ncbi:MAG: hypothetical protein KGK07_14420 [Chloroflexota bacterium]|nr:hypothetical protein [Chloroflexota bacterium]